MRPSMLPVEGRRPGRKIVVPVLGLVLSAIVATLLLPIAFAQADPVGPLHGLYVKVDQNTRSIWIETVIPPYSGGPAFSVCRPVNPGGDYQYSGQDLYSDVHTTVTSFSSTNCSDGYGKQASVDTTTKPGDVRVDLS